MKTKIEKQSGTILDFRLFFYPHGLSREYKVI